MGQPEIAIALAAGALNGESPQWDVERQKLFWVDVRAPALHAFDPATGRNETWEMPASIGCLALTGSGAIVALRTGLYAFDLADASLTPLAPAPFDPRRFIFNDGKCDRQGRFLAGPMFLPLKSPEDASPGPETLPLWRYESGQWQALTPPVRTSNGLAWSPDGTVMYHADTRQRTIWAYDYDVATGMPENRRVFAALAEAEGGPDGASVDRDGFYWCAVFGGSCLLRFDPAGRIERRVPLPIRYPTMPAFGGEDLSTLFVTSANWRLSAEERQGQPLEGALLTLAAPVPGLPTARFATK